MAAVSAAQFIIRVRHSKGMTRFELDSGAATTIHQLKQLIHAQLGDHPPMTTQQLTHNGQSSDKPFANRNTLSALRLAHGSMVYLKIVESAIVCSSMSSAASSGNVARKARKRKRNQISDPEQKMQQDDRQPDTKRSKINNTARTTRSTNNSNSSNGSPARTTRFKKSSGSARKKANKKKDEHLMIESEGETINDIVDNYLNANNAARTAVSALPEHVQSLYTGHARMDAILNEKVQIEEHLELSRFTSKAKSRGKRYLIAVYSANRKRMKEIVCCYEDEQMQQVLNALLWKVVHKKDRLAMFGKNRISIKHVMICMKKYHLTESDVAQRSPALLWSLRHSFPSRSLDDVLKQFVKTAVQTCRLKIAN